MAGLTLAGRKAAPTRHAVHRSRPAVPAGPHRAAIGSTPQGLSRLSVSKGRWEMLSCAMLADFIVNLIS